MLADHYRRDGYVRTPGFVTAGEIDAWARDLHWLVARQLGQLGIPPSDETDPVRRLSRSLIALWRARPEAQGWIYDEVNRRPWIHALASSERLTRLAQEMLGTEQIAIHPRLNLVMSMPNHAWQVADWHQDRFYGPANHLIAYIPLQDTGDWNGGLMVGRGGHTQGVLPHARYEGGLKTKWIRHPPEVVDALDRVQLNLAAGELLLFDGNLPHAAGLNSSDDVRFAVTIRYSNLADPFFVARGWVWQDLADEGLRALQAKENQGG